MEVIVGTAGHIDHGKTALVKALTGVDADRLPEEKQRGITIDLGFAELAFDGIHFGFVDVPGHERFVKNMLAGATGIDVVMLVIAADEGVMPQTREHFEICRLLDIQSGVIVLTKSDQAAEELLELVKLDVAELVEGSFLETATVVETSAKNGSGLAELRNALGAAAKSITRTQNEMVTRLPIDRKFSVKGFGTVVTGTLISGAISENDELELLPEGRAVRVRGIQSHGQTQKIAIAGQRTAVNLGGIDHTEIERGMVISERGVLRPTQIVDAEIELIKGSGTLRSRRRVRLHTGTTETLGRIQILNQAGVIEGGEKDFVQLRLENSIVVVPGDRFIIRSYSPALTIGGGRILDSLPMKHRRKHLADTVKNLARLADKFEDKFSRAEILVGFAADRGLSISDLRAATGWAEATLQNTIKSNLARHTVVEFDGRFFHPTIFAGIKTTILRELENFHGLESLAAGLQREALREKTFPHLAADVFKAILVEAAKDNKIELNGDLVKAASFRTELSDADSVVRDKILQIYKNAKLESPKLEDILNEIGRAAKIDLSRAKKILQMLINEKKILRVTDDFCFDAAVIDELVGKTKSFAAGSTDRLIDVPKFKEIAGVSRKYAIPLLEYFDRQNITRRAGDKRIVL